MKRNQMDMHPDELRLMLFKRKVRNAAIARKCGVSDTTVSRVIDGTTVSDKVRREIAEAAGLDVKEIWPSTYVIQGGPRKPGRPKAFIA